MIYKNSLEKQRQKERSREKVGWWWIQEEEEERVADAYVRDGMGRGGRLGVRGPPSPKGRDVSKISRRVKLTFSL